MKKIVFNWLKLFLYIVLLLPNARLDVCSKNKVTVVFIYSFTTLGLVFICNYCSLFSLSRVMKSIDAVLHLSEHFGLQASDPGILMVEFNFSIVWQLLDASLDDEGLLELIPEKKSQWSTKLQEMEIDGHENYDEKSVEHLERLQNLNTEMAIEIIGLFLKNKLTSRILYLARQNLYVYFYPVRIASRKLYIQL